MFLEYENIKLSMNQASRGWRRNHIIPWIMGNVLTFIFVSHSTWMYFNFEGVSLTILQNIYLWLILPKMIFDLAQNIYSQPYDFDIFNYFIF